jgi:hypothetical protein
MKEKKLQVFVSSTYTDLIEERQAAVEAILASGHMPAGMELFTAGDASQMTVIKRWIDESDIYLLILGGRYGSIEKESGKSYTHLEYEYALSINKPLFAVVINEKALDKKAKEGDYKVVTERENPHLLNEFKSQVLKCLVKFWDDKKDIKLAIHETINDFSFTRKDLVGWVRGDNIVNAGLLAEEIARLTKENSELRGKLNESANVGPLYSGLTYQQLETVLKNEILTIDGKNICLFDYLMFVSEQLVSPTGLIHDTKNKVLIQKLQVFRLVRYSTGIQYHFSEDGHNFYLKTIALGLYPKELNNLSPNVNN